MCGIAGFLNRSSAFTRETQLRVARDMATTLRHRGPDDAGVWVDPNLELHLDTAVFPSLTCRPLVISR